MENGNKDNFYLGVVAVRAGNGVGGRDGSPGIP